MKLSAFAISIAMILPVAVLLTSFFISFRSSQDREKCSPFECGFDPKNKARLPFSLRFFLLAVIFLVFDIEIVLLMPSPIFLSEFSSTSFLISMFLFLLILILGLLHEWHEGSLDWTS
uniref:NADH-ubiquinone oxidoreductase chain 3 n=1 Tax=Eulepethus nanhaiensis TaxID=1881687 RepID=A0A343W6F3_9ANNE|nr:NADH dehydrogenase subunit 3 [Eulepethus nanhaiensis]